MNGQTHRSGRKFSYKPHCTSKKENQTKKKPEEHIRSIKRRHPNLAAGFLGENTVKSAKQVTAGTTDCRTARMAIPSYKSLVINVPPRIAAFALMKLTGEYSSRDTQPWKAEQMYDVGGTQGTAV